jgi:predicted transcriptional regulator of viral defense system
MNYNEFRNELQDYVAFSLDDIRKIEPGFHRRRLNEWQDKGYIQKIRRGYYMFGNLGLSEELLFAIANKLYTPSYVSFEMALSYHGLIPEGVYSVTSATTKKTSKFKTSIGEFSYRSLKPELFFGYDLVSVGRQRAKVAEAEKAVLDYLYLNTTSTSEADLAEWRFNSREFLAWADMDKFSRYVKLFHSPSLERRAAQFLKFIKHKK